MLTVAPALALLVASAAAHPMTAGVARHRAIARGSSWDGVKGYDLESDHGYLEPYEAYSARYAAIGCTGKHGTPFFEACCHPLLATETLEEHRPAECNAPAAPVATPVQDAPAASEPVLIEVPEDNDDDLEDCEEDEEESHATTSTPAPSSSPEPPKEEPTKEEPPKEEPPKEEPPKEEPPKDDNNNDGPSNGGGQVFSGGRVTWYEQHGNPGHCGEYHADSDLIAAMNTAQFYDLDVCGKDIEITGNGNTVRVKVVDSCPGCHPNSVDLSTGAFKALGSLDLGIIDVSWKFV